MIGLALAVDLRAHPAVSVAAAVTLWAYGVAFVTSRWAVESIAFARLNEGRVTWSADAAHAREHLLGLTRWLPSRVEPGTLTGPAGQSLEHWAVLRGRTPVYAPWNVAVSIAGAAAAVTGLLLSGGGTGLAVWAAAVVGGAAALGAARLPRWRKPLVGAGAVGLLAVCLTVAPPHPLVVLLPWVAVMTAYLHFSAQSTATMGHLGRAMRSAVARALEPPARLLVGQHTWQVLESGSRARG
jgi:hypothetical protein